MATAGEPLSVLSNFERLRVDDPKLTVAKVGARGEKLADGAIERQIKSDGLASQGQE